MKENFYAVDGVLEMADRTMGSRPLPLLIEKLWRFKSSLHPNHYDGK